MKQPEIRDTLNVLSRLDNAWPEPTPEEQERCLRFLEKYDALDLVPMLGLAVSA